MNINKIVKTAALTTLVTYSSWLVADEPRDRWNNYRVFEKNSQIYMFIETMGVMDGEKPNVLIHPGSFDPACDNGAFTDSFYSYLTINGRSVEYGRGCIGKAMVYAPMNQTGKDYLISELMRSQSVEIKDGPHTFIFSAIGFTDVFESNYIR